MMALFRKSDEALLPIGGVARVNLMPQGEIERRGRTQLLLRWASGLVGALLVIALLIAGAAALRLVAGQRLMAEQERTNALLAEMAELSEVSGALATQRALETFRASAMAADLDWVALHRTLTAGLPEGVVLEGFDLTTGGVPEGDDPALEVGLTGELTLSSPRPVEIVSVIRDYRQLPGAIDADGRELASEGGAVAAEGEAPRYRYLLTITLDQSIYTATAEER